MGDSGRKLYHVFRSCVTGCTEYRFFKETRQIGRAAAYTGRTFPVYIQGCGQVLRSEIDPDMTLFPGCFRDIPSADGKGLYARVIYRDTGFHTLQTGFGNLEVRHQDRDYRFFRDGTPVARMRSVTGEAPVWGVSEDGWQWRLVLAEEEPLPEALALMLLAFPLVQIGL